MVSVIQWTLYLAARFYFTSEPIQVLPLFIALRLTVPALNCVNAKRALSS
jgi:hypothetical protein